MHQLHAPELSLLLLSKMNLIAWTTISVKAKSLKILGWQKRNPTKVVIVLTNLSSLHLVWQILFKHALRLILIIYNSLQNRLTVSRIYVDVTNQANKWKKSLLNFIDPEVNKTWIKSTPVTSLNNTNLGIGLQGLVHSTFKPCTNTSIVVSKNTFELIYRQLSWF